MIPLAVKSLDELPENVRGVCKVEGDIVSLDDTLFRTKADVDAVSEAKRKETNDHSATKAVLAKWKEIGENPESVLEELTDLRNRAGKGTDLTEKVTALQKELRLRTTERDGYKTELDGIKPQYEAQLKQIRDAKTSEVLERLVGNLKGIDNAKLIRSLKKDVALGLISLDETDEGLTVKTGETFEKYAMGQAEDYGFILKNTPGISNPPAGGNQRVQSNPQGFALPGQDLGFLDPEVAKALG